MAGSMTWKAAKPISARCASALAWCRTFAGQWDAKRLRRVDWLASPYRNVVGHGVTKSTWRVPHSIAIYLNTKCDGGDLMWEEAPVYVSKKDLEISRHYAEEMAKAQLSPGQLLGEMRVVKNRVRFATWGRYRTKTLDHAAVWIFAHEMWHWLTGTRQIRAANTEQYARAAASRIANLYAADRTAAEAANYLRANALDVIHEKE
jgi:hypothetical protein